MHFGGVHPGGSSKRFLWVLLTLLSVACIVVHLYRDIVPCVGQQTYDQGLLYLSTEAGLSGLVLVLTIPQPVVYLVSPESAFHTVPGVGDGGPLNH